jgi:hypothetical protein
VLPASTPEVVPKLVADPLLVPVLEVPLVVPEPLPVEVPELPPIPLLDAVASSLWSRAPVSDASDVVVLPPQAP